VILLVVGPQSIRAIALLQKSDLALPMSTLFVFYSCYFVDYRCFCEKTGAIHEVTRINTKFITTEIDF